MFFSTSPSPSFFFPSIHPQNCSKSIGDADFILPLRMKALLLLGLSRILQKKAQLLVADCLRIQSAIGDVMSIHTNDLPRDAMIANDQQITLLSAPGARSLVDVDMSVDQGDVVDRWIEAVRLVLFRLMARTSRKISSTATR